MVDLRLSDYGATPDKPDVFVQVNYTQTRSCVLWVFNCSTRNRRPSLAAMSDVATAFKTHGIRIHIDAGQDSVMNPDTGDPWGSLSRAGKVLSAPARLQGWNDSTGMNWTTQYDCIARRP